MYFLFEKLFFSSYFDDASLGLFYQEKGGVLFRRDRLQMFAKTKKKIHEMKAKTEKKEKIVEYPSLTG